MVTVFSEFISSSRLSFTSACDVRNARTRQSTKTILLLIVGRCRPSGAKDHCGRIMSGVQHLGHPDLSDISGNPFAIGQNQTDTFKMVTALYSSHDVDYYYGF